MVARGELTNILGTLKVHYDLKKEYEKQGHVVDVLDYSVIYPKGLNEFTKIFGRLYTYKFWRFLKKHAHKYDVIDANSECVVYPKESFGFKGVLLVRSHGIRPVYDNAEKIKSYKAAFDKERETIKFKTRLGNIYRYIQKKPGFKEFFKSVKFADLVHCLNSEEYDYFLKLGVPKEKLLSIPNSLPDAFIHQLNQSKTDKKLDSLAFIGSWTIRKGIKDIDNIITKIRKKTHIKSLFLLGGHYNEQIITKDFSPLNIEILQIIPIFKPEQLSTYLETCKIGLFPSYVEGFSLAVIEQLACGIPVVAYRVPGPLDILKGLDESLLIEPGNTEAFANKVIEILKLNKTDYSDLSEKCKIESRKYLLSDISQQFLNAYKKKLRKGFH